MSIVWFTSAIQRDRVFQVVERAVDPHPHEPFPGKIFEFLFEFPFSVFDIGGEQINLGPFIQRLDRGDDSLLALRGQGFPADRGNGACPP